MSEGLPSIQDLRLSQGVVGAKAINGRFDKSALRNVIGIYVYAWLRGDQWLYVGLSSAVFTRICTHSVINKKEPLRDGDVVYIWSVSDWSKGLELEAEIVNENKPKYNKNISSTKLYGKPRTPKTPLPNVDCQNCNVRFTPYRRWQKFCSTKCRQLYYWKTHDVIKTDQGDQVVLIAVPVQTSQT